jgi:hypothetical protein
VRSARPLSLDVKDRQDRQQQNTEFINRGTNRRQIGRQAGVKLCARWSAY